MQPIRTNYGIITRNTSDRIQRLVLKELGGGTVQTFVKTEEQRIDHATYTAMQGLFATEPEGADAYLAKLARQDAEMPLRDPYEQVFGIASVTKEGY